MPRRLLTLAALAALLAGCNGYQTDLITICNARARSGVSADAGADEQVDQIGAYLMTHVHTPKAKRLFATMGSKTPAQRAEALAKEAKAEGVSPCPLAEEFGAK